MTKTIQNKSKNNLELYHWRKTVIWGVSFGVWVTFLDIISLEMLSFETLGLSLEISLENFVFYWKYFLRNNF